MLTAFFVDCMAEIQSTDKGKSKDIMNFKDVYKENGIKVLLLIVHLILTCIKKPYKNKKNSVDRAN